MKLHYDREADILYIDTCPPYANQVSDELSDEIVVRRNAQTGEIENLEVLWFSTRVLNGGSVELPIRAALTTAA